MAKFKNLRQLISVQGNGKIITKEFTVSSFLRLHLSISKEIEIHQSNEEKVVIEVDKNLADHIEITNFGKTLYINTETGIFKKPIYTVCKVKVYYRQLTVLNLANEKSDLDCKQLLDLPNDVEIYIQSIGNTHLRINAPNIKIKTQCVGDVTLEGKCHTLDIKHESEGNLFSKDLIADEVVLKNRGAGDINVFAKDTISIRHMGAGNIFYYGSAVLKDVKHYGDGLVQHKEG
ncbi:MAG: DUF2807 domain-containing protein [Bacteroidetes bacterium]|nr:DUF2807 domain-containing protein [Bacteroidota bacterium]